MVRKLVRVLGSSVLSAALVVGAGVGTAVHAAGLLEGVKNAVGSEVGGSTGSGSGALRSLGGLGLPAIGSGTASNAAGVLGYCIKNNYLSGGAQGVKDSLMGKLGLGSNKAQQDQGYQSGLSGMLTGSDGKNFSLEGVSGKVKQKACDYVLDNAKSLL